MFRLPWNTEIRLTSVLCFTLLAVASNVEADTLVVTGGQTSVRLDTDALSMAGLDVSGFSSDVIMPGELGPDSVAFAINARSDAQPTTFFYDFPNFAPFGGTIEHSGMVFFDQQFGIGNFSIGFDENRMTGPNSGFFVESTTEGMSLLSGIFFDIETPSLLELQANSLTIEANLLVSPELAGFLGNSSLIGADVGDALVSATAIPEPSAFAAFVGLGLASCLRRRR